MKSKIIFFWLFCCLFAMDSLAAESHILELKIAGGGSNLSAYAKRTMEKNAVNLLTMMSDAQARGSKSLNFSGIAITQDAKNAIVQMWKYQPLRIREVDGAMPQVKENLLNISSTRTYQVRNIPVLLFPRETPGADKESEVAICFSSNGTITDFNITIEKNQYDQIMKGARTVQDVENRWMLAHWMEELQSAYVKKDLNYLRSLFDNDALIITGVRSSTRTGTEVKFKTKETFDYYVQNKTQYLNKMNRIFNNNKVVRVNFEDQEYGSNEIATVINQYGEEMPRYYMVWCTQDWMTSSYSDKGRLFVLWDFKDPEHPVILVRAWTHPDDPKQFSIDDFDLND